VSLGDSLRGLKEFVGKRLLDKIGVDFGNYLNWENNVFSIQFSLGITAGRYKSCLEEESTNWTQERIYLIFELGIFYFEIFFEKELKDEKEI